MPSKESDSSKMFNLKSTFIKLLSCYIHLLKSPVMCLSPLARQDSWTAQLQ